VFGVQAELSQSAANLPSRSLICGWPGPPFVSSFVLKLEKTAVGKKHRRFVELRVGDIAGECFSREIGAAHADILATDYTDFADFNPCNLWLNRLLELLLQWYWGY
jgi:hypothetical protein